MTMLPRLNTGKSRSDWYKPNKPKPIVENAMEDMIQIKKLGVLPSRRIVTGRLAERYLAGRQ